MEDCFGGEAGVANLGTGVQLLDVEYLDARIAVVGVVFLDVDTGRGGRLCQTSLLSCWASPWTSSLTAGTPTPTYGIATITYRSLQQITAKACIHAHAPYLSHLLKMDNLPPFCKHVSEHVLREAKSTVVSV